MVKHLDKRDQLADIIKPKKLCDTLFLNLKTFKPVPIIKGAIWYLIGLLYSHYPNLL
jgi:hypothetical protein